MSILTFIYMNAIGNLAVVIFLMVYRKNHLNSINTLHLFSQTMFALAFTSFSLSYMGTFLDEFLTLLGNIAMISGSIGILMTILTFTKVITASKQKSLILMGLLSSILTVIWSLFPAYSNFRIGTVTFTVALSLFWAGYTLYRNDHITGLQKMISMSFFIISGAHFYRVFEIFDFSSLYVMEIPSLGNSMIMFSMFFYLIVSGSGIVMMFKESADSALYELATYDQLTKTLNRNIFVEKAQEILNTSVKDSYVGLAMVDIDQFKVVNDTYGHFAGDDLLKRFAAILTKEMGENELLGRYGGDEFIMLLQSESTDALYAKCERMRLSVQSASKEASKTTGSFGAAVRLNPCVTDFDELSRVADQALYHSKSVGKNTVTIRYI